MKHAPTLIHLSEGINVTDNSKFLLTKGGIQLGRLRSNDPVHDEFNAFIIRACNSHDDLVNALTAMLHDYRDITDETYEEMDVIKNAVSALAKAGDT